MKGKILIKMAFASLLLASCNLPQQKNENGAESQPEQKDVPEQKAVLLPQFSRDSAMAYVRAQCDFGARVPNSEPHAKCAAYLEDRLKSFGASVKVQEADVVNYAGKTLHAKNIIAQVEPDKERRIILFAHWDSRHCCDQDEDKANYSKPVMAANDGASGVAVLMEIARIAQLTPPSVGLDIVLLDAEDTGKPSYEEGEATDDWCLGSQYWSKNPHYKVKPEFGILLDMVGGTEPEFNVDGVSERVGMDIVSLVWGHAEKMGYGRYFVMARSGNLIDDHYYINKYAQIPTIDIIDFNRERGFPEMWHTAHDTPENINPSSLEMVGKVLIKTIYEL